MRALARRTHIGLSVAVVAIFAFAVHNAYAQQYVALETPGMPGSCEITPTWGFVDVAVVHYAGAGARGLQFAAPVTSCLGPSAAWLSDNWAFGPVIGNSQDGVALPYGQCLSGTVVLGVIKLMIPEIPSPCCHLQLLPHPSSASGKVEALDCAGSIVPINFTVGGVFNAGGTTCAAMDPPHTPAPAPGATDVALNTTLSWTPGETRNPCGLLASPYGILSMGTHPDSLVDIGWDMPNPFDPGVLDKATTYYWKVVYSFGEDGATSPLWEFTTSDTPLPTEATTWGRLKALYE